MKNKKRKKLVIRDFAIVIFSVVLATILAKSNLLVYVLDVAQGLKFLGSFLAGIFFISIFTVAPASVVLYEIAKSNPALEVAFFGGLGAVVGDLIIFRFVKDSISEDIKYFIEKTKLQKLTAIFKLKPLRWLTVLLGALIIASPIPDELGLAMMGLTKIKNSAFILISFTLNFFGIFIICLIAKGFHL